MERCVRGGVDHWALGLALALGERLGAQATPPATGQPGPFSRTAGEVSPVTPRGPIRLTATPPKIATPEPAANGSTLNSALRRIARVPALPRCDVRAVVAHADGERHYGPQANPSVVIGDFSKPNPLVNFRLEDVAFVYGTKWKQRYFLRRGSDYYPANAQWDIINRTWRTYHVQPNTEWWLPHYPANPGDNSTGPHRSAVRRLPLDELQRADQTSRRSGMWGASAARARQRPRCTSRAKGPSSIHHVSSYVSGERRLCLQCHTQGKPTQKSLSTAGILRLAGRFSRRAASQKLLDAGRAPSWGDHFTHFAEGTAKKNRMQAERLRCSPDVFAAGSPASAATTCTARTTTRT